MPIDLNTLLTNSQNYSKVNKILINGVQLSNSIVILAYTL